MSQVINTDTAIRGGQFICGTESIGSVGVAGIAAMGFGLSSAMEGAAAFKAPVLIGDPNPFVSPLKQGSVMITRRPGLLDGAALQLLPIVSIQNNVPMKTLPYDVLLGNIDTPVGVTMFTGETPVIGGVKQISGTTIKQTGPEGQTFLTLIKSHVEAFLEDIGIKNFTGVKMENGVDTNMALEVGNAPSVNATIQKGSDCVSSAATLNQTFGIATKALSVANSKKGFDIPHPSKDGYRLRYICLEGPEAEVYLRGNLKGNTIIELPDVWRDIVDPDSIGVSLTPIGCYQELFMEKIQWGTQIVVKNNLSGPINCSYVVYGTRKDTPKNIPEYKGLTTDDYPGDNREYRLNDN